MATERQPGGYADRAALATAIRLNEAMAKPLRRLVREGGRLSQLELFALLAGLAVMLAEQTHALITMDKMN